MRNKGGIFFYVIILLSSLIVCAPSFAFAGIGVSPAEIISHDILNDVPHNDQVILTRSGDVSKASAVKVEFRGDAKSFIKGAEQISFEAGESQLVYKFQIIASSLTNGDYSAEIDFIGIQPANQNNAHLGAVNVLGGVTLQIHFTVSNTEKLDYEVIKMTPIQTEEGLPLFINYTIKNNGNLNWKPDFITASLFNNRGRLIEEKIVSGSDLEFTEPGETHTHIIDLFSTLNRGEYTLVVEFQYKDKTDTTTSNFEIYGTGVLKQSGVLSSVIFDKTSYTSGELVQFNAIFTNNGETSYFANMVTEVYDGESIVDILKTEPIKVSIGETVTFNQILPMTDQGEFRILSYVEYGNRTSETKTSDLAIASPIIEKTINYLLIILSALLLMFIGLFVAVHKKAVYTKPPKINTPIRITSPQITGTSIEKDGALIEVIVNGVSLGLTMVGHGIWAINVPANTLSIGAQVIASVRVDANHDGVVNLKDKQSDYSNIVIVTV